MSALDKKKRRRGLGASPLITLPAWTIGEQQDGAGLTAALALAGVEGKWIRLDAKSQWAVITSSDAIQMQQSNSVEWFVRSG